MLRILPVLLLLILPALGLGQSASIKMEAHTLSTEGEEFMREGKYPEALARFDRALQLDPKNRNYALQLARARFFQKEYSACMDLLRPMMAGKKSLLEAHRLYGNCQDELGQDYEALATYRQALERFPGSGVLCMEMGILEFSRHRDSTALAHWEEGIRIQPTFAPNYYFAAKACSAKGDQAWASTYAEAFINLERTGERVRELSKLLYAALQSARHYDYAGVFRWRFEGAGQAEALHQLLNQAYTSALPDTAWVPSIATLSASRRFAAFYIPAREPASGAHEMFLYLQTIAAAGHWEAYNYWLLYDAAPVEFFDWYEHNKAKYEAFEAWFIRAPFQKVLRKPIVRPVQPPASGS